MRGELEEEDGLPRSTRRKKAKGRTAWRTLTASSSDLIGGTFFNLEYAGEVSALTAALPGRHAEVSEHWATRNESVSHAPLK